MIEEKIRADERRRIQKYIDENNIRRVEYGHFNGGKWVNLKTYTVKLYENPLYNLRQ